MTMVNLTECGPYRRLMQALLVAIVLCGSACTPPRNLRKVELVIASMDSVRVRITGTVMLDGGCSGDRPLWALELRTDSGWVERMPFPGAQHLCGPGSWRWRKREVLIPLRDEVLHGLRATDHVLAPGMYRLVFMGRGGKRKATRAYEL